ncbi:MAG: sigma-70 family RNA polymerase sigma factor [Lachnospiraceae bacterium]|nr:sigma-70 family RNA polymerase sigma factor [Lachnospiraceae bacterium]
MPEEEMPESASWENGFEHAEWVDFLNGLDEKYRIVVMLHYVEGFRAKEISQILDISESAVYVRLTRAREMMRQQYGTETETGDDPVKNRETMRLKKMVPAHLAGPAAGSNRKGELHGQI